MNTENFKKFLAKEGIEPDSISKLDAHEQSRIYAEFADSIYEETQGSVDTISEKFNEMQEAYTTSNKKTAESLQKIQETQKIQGVQMSKMTGSNKQDALKSLSDKVDNAIKSYKNANKNEVFASFTDAEIKALRVNKANFVSGDVSGNTDSMLIDEIGQLPTRSVRFFDLFAPSAKTVSRNSNGVVRYSDWDDATTVRAAAQIAEGGTFPESTQKFVERSKDLKKTGDSYTISQESAYDRARFVQEFNMFMDTNMALVLDQQIYDGDGTGENHTGIYTTAETYTPVASGLTDANIFDLIRKTRTNITSGFQKTFAPNMLAMNPVDIDRMLLKKDANNNYVRPDFFRISDGAVNMYIVAGLAIIETNVVTVNTMLAGDSRFAELYQEEGGFQMIRGYKTGDWEDDLESVKVRRRMLTLVREMYAGAFNKVTDITAALATLATLPA